MATNERRDQTRPSRQIADRFLHWTWTRAALARGWWLATSVYLVVVADLSPLELVLLGTFQGITVVAAEVPTGVLADTVSRKWSLVLAHLVMGTGMALTGVVTAFPALVVTQVLWGLGWALSDGADVAWVTDELDRPDLIDRVLTSRGRRELWGAATGLIAFGGFAWAVSLATAMVTAGLAMIGLGLVEVARFPERGFVPKRERRLAEAMAILVGGARLAGRDRQILVVLVATMLVNGALEVFGRLHPRRLLNLDFPQSPDPIVWFTALALVALALGIAALHAVEARIDGTHTARRTYALVCLVGTAGLLLLASAPDIRTAIAGVLLVSGITSPVARTVSTIWVNRRATGELRATVHSFLAQAENLGEILLGATLGIIAGTAGIPIALTAAAALVAGTCLLVAVGAPEPDAPRAAVTSHPPGDPSRTFQETRLMPRMHKDEITIDEALVRRLLTKQMPEMADRPLRVVQPWGTDHAIWRLGHDLVVRLPRIHWAESQVQLEAAWLPRLAPHLPVAVPEPVATGAPGEGYPYLWAVHRWLPGTGAALNLVDNPVTFALDLAQVVGSLQHVPTTGAPPAKGRARPLHEYDVETRQAIDGARHLIDAQAATTIWEEALAAPAHDGPPRWVHGDLEGNCLVEQGRLSGLVDWGSACAGDTAVDVQVIWSPLFTEESRHAFLDVLDVDAATLARSKGAAINQACAALPYYLHSYPQIVQRSWHKLSALGVPLQSAPY